MGFFIFYFFFIFCFFIHFIVFFVFFALFFFFNGGENVLFEGCSCILSSSKLIGLEHVVAHSPGLIGIKHKQREDAAGLNAAINVCEHNHIWRKKRWVGVGGFPRLRHSQGQKSTLFQTRSAETCN